MFLSISECQPNSSVISSFTVNSSQILDIDSNIEISVNGEVTTQRPINLIVDDVVSANISTPSDFLAHNIYEYTINSVKNYFAVVNKNDYRPTVKASDAGKRWFNYAPANFRVSFYDSLSEFQRPLGSGRRQIDIANTHIALDHINAAVCFYSSNHELISRVNLPSGPIEYKKISYYDNVLGRTVTESLILCADKKLYRIRFDNRYIDGEEYSPTVIPVETADNLWFEQDLPTGESFIESRRREFLAKTKPPTTALDVTETKIWIAGYDAVYVLNRNFQQTLKIDLPDEKIINIAALNNDAIAVTRDGKIFFISAQGTYNLLLQTAALGSPCSINSGSSVAVPDPDNQRLLIFSDDTGSFSTWDTPDFAPAYAREFNNKLWVTGHDSNKILKFNSDNNYSTYYFTDKVTLVSVVDNSILSMHYLQDFVTLDLTGIQKIIPVRFLGKSGPIGHIGSDPVQVKMLGEEGIPLYTSNGLTAWVNGISGETAKTGDFIGVSYRAEFNGVFNSVVIVGDTAYDYRVTAESVIKYSDYFEDATVARNRMTPPFVAYIPPDSGDIDTGVTGPVDIGFTWNMWGQLYNQIYVNTDGVLNFANNGSISINSLHIEPKNLYQGGAINNVDPNNIYEKLDSSEFPGLYIKNGEIGEFNYLRLRWVGTEYQSNLIGHTATVTSNTTSSSYIPLSSINDLAVGNYISGNGITTSTQILNVASYNKNVEKIKQVGNFLVINNDENFNYLPYTTVTGVNSGNVDITRLLLNVSTTSRILTVSNSTVKTDQTIAFNPDFYTARIALTNGLTVTNSNISNIVLDSSTITCLTTIDATNFTVSQLDYEKIYVQQTIENTDSNTIFRITSKNFSESQGYVITTSITHNLTAGDTALIKSIDITFSDTLPTNILVGGNLTLYSYSWSVSNAEKFQQDSILNFQANIAEVNQSVSLISGSELLFANDYAAPAYTYEVGLYQGNNYQYIEYFYDSTNHDSSTQVGINLGQDNQLIASSPTARSIVFSGNLAAGDFTNFNGLGTFNENSDNFVFRNVSYVKSITDNDQQDRIEILIDRQITEADAIRISSNYGYLYVNSSPYYGDSYITENSIISLKTPFNDSFRPIAPLLGIGDLQVSIPMISRTVPTPPQQLIEIYDNQTPNSIVTANVTIPVTGTYFIPDYFRYPEILGTSDISFQRVRNGVITNLNWGNYEFLAGDTVIINRQLVPKGLYDYIDVDIVGPVFLKVRWQTSGGDTFDQLNFGTLDNPFTRNQNDYIESNVAGLVSYEDDTDYYVTANVLLTSNTITTGKLYIDTPASEFLVNGVVISNTLDSVNTGANIAIRRKVLNYFQSNLDIYQVKYDTITSTNVFIPIGSWNINNKIILNSVADGKTSAAVVAPLISEYNSYNYSSSDLTNDDNFVNQTINLQSLQETLLEKDYLTNTILTSEILGHNQNEIDRNIDFVAFNQNNLSANSSLAQQLSKISYLSGELQSKIEDNTIFTGSVNAPENLYSKTYFTSLISNILSESTTPFSFKISQLAQVKNNILTSFIISHALSKTEILSFGISEVAENKKSLFTDTLIGDIDSNKSLFGSSFHESLIDSISVLVDKLSNDNESMKNIFKYSLLGENETITSSVYDSLISNFDISRKYLFTKINEELDSTSNLLFSQLEDEFSTIVQIITNRLAENFEHYASINKNNISESNEPPSKLHTGLLESQIIVPNAYFTSFIHEKLDSVSSLINSIIEQQLNSVKTITTGSVVEQLNSVATAFSFILNLLDAQNKNILYERIDNALENSRTEFDSKLQNALTTLTTSFVNQLTSNLDSLGSSIISNLESNLDSLGSSINSSLESNLMTAKNVLADNLDSSMDNTRSTFTNKIEVDLDGNVTKVLNLINEFLDNTKTVIETQVQYLNEITPSLVEKLNAVIKDAVANNIAVPTTFVNDNMATIIDLILQNVKEDNNYSQQQIEFIKDSINSIVNRIETVIHKQASYINIVPNMFYDIKHLVPYQPTLVYDIENIVPYHPEIIFEPKPEWTSDEINQTGAIKSNISIYANNGRGGDKITNMGNPADIGPMVLYTKEFNYDLGGFENLIDASNMAVKYLNADAMQIVGTNFWNYRIYFDKKVYCVPKKGMVFPIKWFIRGG